MRTTTRVYYSPLRAPSALAPVSHKAAHLPARTFDSHLALAAPSTPFAAPSTPFSTHAQHSIPRHHSAACALPCVCCLCAFLCCARGGRWGGMTTQGKPWSVFLMQPSAAALITEVIISDPFFPVAVARALPCPPPLRPPCPLPRVAPRPADDEARISVNPMSSRKAA